MIFKPRLLLSVTIEHDHLVYSASALVDSGSEQNLIDIFFARRLGLPLVSIKPSIPAKALNNHIFVRILYHAKPVTVITSGNHQRLVFYALHSPDTPLTFGYSWLRLHNPRLDWEGQRVLSWSLFCHSNCLTSAPAPGPETSESQEESSPDLTGVPAEYHDLREVFRKDRACDCSVDLLP